MFLFFSSVGQLTFKLTSKKKVPALLKSQINIAGVKLSSNLLYSYDFIFLAFHCISAVVPQRMEFSVCFEIDLHEVEVKKKPVHIFAAQDHVNSARISSMMDCKHKPVCHS